MSSGSRKDPTYRYADGAQYGTQIRNPHPDYRYVLVNQSTTNGNFSVDFYEEMGYEAVKQPHPDDQDSERLKVRVAAKPGEPIEYRGAVLMRIKKEAFEQLKLHGGLSGVGTRHWDRLMERLDSKTGFRHMNLVGPRGSYITVRNTGAEEL